MHKTLFYSRLKGDQIMKMLFSVEFPPEPFNTYVRDGNVGKILSSILDDIKPEAAYFTEQSGKRGALFVVEVAGATDITRIAEPFFLKFKAECKFRILMTPKELAGAGLEALGNKWA
jgi:hypothetical protein